MNDTPHSENPYEAPKPAAANPFSAVPTETTSQVEPARDRKIREIGRLFLAWERLRIFYNLALLVITLPLAILTLSVTHDLLQTASELLGVCIAGFLGANFCFLLGHYLTAWLVIFGAPGKTVMVLLFWCGVGISIPIAAFAVMSVNAVW